MEKYDFLFFESFAISTNSLPKIWTLEFNNSTISNMG